MIKRIERTGLLTFKPCGRVTPVRRYKAVRSFEEGVAGEEKTWEKSGKFKSSLSKLGSHYKRTIKLAIRSAKASEIFEIFISAWQGRLDCSADIWSDVTQASGLQA